MGENKHPAMKSSLGVCYIGLTGMAYFEMR